MARTRSIEFAFGFGMLAVATLIGGCGPTPPRRPPIVLIAIDTLRADHLGSYGHPWSATPHIDRVAREGVRYTRAFSQAPWTTPSLGALLASEYPSVLGIEGEASRLPEDAFLLPEALREAGYATAAVVSHIFVSEKWGFGQGFQSFTEYPLGHGRVSSKHVSDRALADLEALRGAPFFLFLHYFDPHFDYIEHEGFRFDEVAPPYTGPVRSGMRFGPLQARAWSLRRADAKELDRLYTSEIAFTDHHVGRVLERLRVLGLYDEALIVITADHGEAFLDHGRLGHTGALYEELVRVPLIIKYPHGEPEEVHAPVALIDVYPTVADYLDLELGRRLRGRSLLSGDLPGTVRPIFMETSRRMQLRGVVLGRHKLVRNLARSTDQLFDLEADPEEQHDLAGARPEVAESLGALLDGWIQEMDGAEPPQSPLHLTEEEVGALRSLGYIEGNGDEGR